MIVDSVCDLAPGAYDITITNIDGCTVDTTIVLTNINSLVVDASPEITTINLGDSVQLNVMGGTSYAWSPSSSLNCNNCSNPVATPSETTSYIVSGSDSNGCVGTDTVVVNVNSHSTGCGTVYVPTVFSPKGSGNIDNQKVCVYGNCIAELSFSVYNRWGEMIFKSNNTDLTDCWDGTYKGKVLDSGVYAYQLLVKLTNGELIVQSGNITLIR
jgi:gliding motility-associated-like protein